MNGTKLVRVNSRISIPRAEFSFSFVRSSGPGGQNVNKVNSKAQLRWSVVGSPSLPEDVRERLLSRYARRITDRGELVLSSQRYRDQAKNIVDCVNKLVELVLSVATAPRARKATKVPRGARETRLREKRAASERKRRRSPPGRDE
jgi:ribosome-associated protein